MKKIGSLFLIVMLLLLPTFAAGCSSSEIDFDRENSVRVEFDLQGGSYMNSTANIVYYYKFEPGTRNKIKNPAAEEEKDRFGKSTVTRDEYTLDGWYRTRVDTDGYITYSDPWDFDSDKVDKNGVKLYAKWNPLIHYTYRLYRMDTGNPIGTAYEVNQGDKFADYLRYATNVSGYTFVEFCDEAGNPWDPEYKHPGGETDTEIKVFVKLERGVFREIATKEELLNQIAINSSSLQIANHRDIRLTADIDLEGEAFDGFRNFGRILDGGGHKISNFTLKYPNDFSTDPIFDGSITFPVSMFGMCNNAIVKDVTFDGMTIDVNHNYFATQKIIVAPLAIKSTKSTFTNVTVNATYTYSRLPNNSSFDTPEHIAENLIGITDKGYYFKDDASVFENVTVNIDKRF